ncbi:unnamed protein product [Amoebophrya sp. A25]|nr:unnamed protein product [Amoebophrya sp. A25]|eukprot:GSA25T00027391001.1
MPESSSVFHQQNASSSSSSSVRQAVITRKTRDNIFQPKLKKIRISVDSDEEELVDKASCVSQVSPRTKQTLSECNEILDQQIPDLTPQQIQHGRLLKEALKAVESGEEGSIDRLHDLNQLVARQQEELKKENLHEKKDLPSDLSSSESSPVVFTSDEDEEVEQVAKAGGQTSGSVQQQKAAVGDAGAPTESDELSAPADSARDLNPDLPASPIPSSSAEAGAKALAKKVTFNPQVDKKSPVALIDQEGEEKKPVYDKDWRLRQKELKEKIVKERYEKELLDIEKQRASRRDTED